MKQWLVGLAFMGILASLGSALVFMMRGNGKDAADANDPTRAHRMLASLALRVGLSVALFLCILLAWKLGWIQPADCPSATPDGTRPNHP